MNRFLRDEKGATSIEYALIAVLVSIVIVGGATLVGTTLRSTFTSVGSAFVASR